MAPLDFDTLMNGVVFESLADEAALQHIGWLIDAASDRNDGGGIDRALAWGDEMEKRSLTDVQEMTLSYFRGNAWGVRYRIRVAGKPTSWNWEQPELAEELFCLRKAIAHNGFLKLPRIRQCQILTNSANCLNSVGRCVEAIELFTRALRSEPVFWEALGNRGKALIEYGRSHYDHKHSYWLTYLSLGMHQEERRRNAEDKKAAKNKKRAYLVPMSLKAFPDEWKL